MRAPNMKRPCWLISLLMAFACCTAGACRFNVRDLGFADLDLQHYRLFYFVSTNESPIALQGIKSVGDEVLRDSNVELVTVRMDGSEPSGARKLLEAHQLDRLPAMVLVSPDQQSLAVPLNRDAKTAETAVVNSPLREKILKSAVETYGVVLLVEGNDAEQNRNARQVADAAVKQITEAMPRLPKPIHLPPLVLVVPPEQTANENILLWSLGFEPDQQAWPAVGVLYGRGKRIGPVLRGADLRQPRLLQLLGVVGQDCECYLDRSWMHGPVMPARWGESVQKRVVAQLGFDAESPMIKAEMNAILERGPNPNAKPASFIGGTDAELLGYHEAVLDAPTPATNQQPNLPVASSNSKPVSLDAISLRQRFPVGVLLLLAVLALGGGLMILFRRRQN